MPSILTKYIALAVVLGLGKALVYPTFLATIAGFTHSKNMAQSLSIFRFWHNFEKAIGAILTGLLLHYIGSVAPFYVMNLLTIFSAVVIIILLKATTLISS